MCIVESSADISVLQFEILKGKSFIYKVELLIKFSVEEYRQLNQLVDIATNIHMAFSIHLGDDFTLFQMGPLTP